MACQYDHHMVNTDLLKDSKSGKLKSEIMGSETDDFGLKLGILELKNHHIEEKGRRRK